jgi:diguanylate cyclase (GGDEF)-like protein
MIVGAVLTALVLVGAGVVFALRIRRRRSPLNEGPRELSLDPAPIRSTTKVRKMVSAPIRLSDLTRAAQESHSRREDQEDFATLQLFLEDLRDLYAGDEAIYWEWVEQRDSLTPRAWSSASADRPQHFRMIEWAAHVQWAAKGRVVHQETSSDLIRVAAAPVLDEGRLLGVLSITSEKGLRVEKGRLKQWLPRHATQLTRLLDLFTIRREYGRHMRQGRALLQAVQRIQSNPSQDALVRAICETAIGVSSATDSALIRWRADKGKGIVQFATPGFRRRPPFDISDDSLVAQVCRARLPLVIEDASRLASDVTLFFANDGECRTGAFGIVPLARDERVLGAIVVASPSVGGVLQDETRNIDLLGAVATTSLEIAWDLEEASKRARTDPLTGLANRRWFEDKIDQALNEADRFGVPVSLVLVDLDHFKRVNDTWGHEAGDLVLRKVARMLAEGVRTVDTVARYGGEELAILLPQTAMAGAVELSDRLRRMVAARTIHFQATEIMITASFGVASYPESAPSRDTLFPAADRALYEAKHSGRNCVRSASAASRGPKS